jgi:lipopolysaccharide/colanic/teichoic acid biosynthesis glycosyltransferase
MFKDLIKFVSKIICTEITFKTFLDKLLSLLGIVLLSPVFIVVFVVLFFNNKGKVFFVQNRPGKNGKIFKIIKFKTMNDKKDAQGNLLSDADRLSVLAKSLEKLL